MSLTPMTWAEAVRRRPGMYLGLGPTDPQLPTALIETVIVDALTTVDGAAVAVEITVDDTSFVLTDDRSWFVGQVNDAQRDFFGQRLIHPSRAGLLSGVALTARATVAVDVVGWRWCQEFRHGEQVAAPVRAEPAASTGTMVTGVLDADYFVAPARLADAATIKNLPRVRAAAAQPHVRLTITDRRH